MVFVYRMHNADEEYEYMSNYLILPSILKKWLKYIFQIKKANTLSLKVGPKKKIIVFDVKIILFLQQCAQENI